MTDKWWKWKKRSEWDEFFKEFDKLEKMVDDMTNDSAKDFFAEKDEKKLPNPYVFGFSVSVGPDGKPQVHKFGSLPTLPSLPVSPQGMGNVRESKDAKEMKEEVEPLVDVLDDKKEVIVVADLPGMSREDIKLDVSETALEISVNTPNRNFYKSLVLPARVRVGSMQTSYRNGVLEIHLRKASGALISIKKHLASGV